MVEKKLLITKEGPILKIIHKKKNVELKYDLVNRVMLKNYNGNWKPVAHQYEVFQGVRLFDIETEDEKFKRLLELTAEINPGCKSVSSFITRMEEALVYEDYITEGVKFFYSVRTNSWGEIRRDLLSKPLHKYSKHAINFFKTYGTEVGPKIEEWYFSNTKKADKLILDIQSSVVPPDERGWLLSYLIGSYYGDDFFTLTDEYKYDTQALLNYVYGYLKPFEGLDVSESIRTLKDYYGMAQKMGRDVKKYPKYLHSIHDIITANYNTFKKHYDEIAFKNLMKNNMVYESKEFCVVVPEKSKDIVSEGTDLNHCVSSYVDMILRGETYIMFLRKKKEKEKSLVTLELKGEAIVQARGAYNRALTKEESDFLEEYVKKKKLKLMI